MLGPNAGNAGGRHLLSGEAVAPTGPIGVTLGFLSGEGERASVHGFEHQTVGIAAERGGVRTEMHFAIAGDGVDFGVTFNRNVGDGDDDGAGPRLEVGERDAAFLGSVSRL